MTLVGDLSEPEKLIWEAFAAGGSVKFGTKADDPATGAAWGTERQVRADVLVALLSGAAKPEPSHVGTVDLQGAHILGKISAPGSVFDHQLRLTKCYIPNGLELSETKTRSLRLRNCHVGPIRVKGARIEGVFDISGTQVIARHGPALNADGLIVSQDMVCENKFHARGEVRLLGATIGGRAKFGDAELNGRGSPALNADGLCVTQDLFCDGNFKAKGEILLIGATIGGQLSFRSAQLNGRGSYALNADLISVAQGALFSGKFRSLGPINLANANVKGMLHFHNARLDGKGGPALEAEAITVTQGMFCTGKFRSKGQIVLSGAKIEGHLIFSSAQLNGVNGLSLVADVLSVSQDLYCNEKFRARGGISLADASIGSQLSFSSARLDGRGGPALIGDGVTVVKDFFCDENFHAIGEVTLRGAKIGTLTDDKKSWPKRMRLDGLIYDNLTYMSAGNRLRWLKRSVGYRAQPYEHLAAYYRRLGHDEQARRVLLAKQRTRTNQHPWWLRGWGWLQDGIAGYGYAPGRALVLLVAAFIAGWLVFRSHHPAAVGPGPHPEFNAALYTLDVLIPAPSLGDANDWDPHGAALALATGLHVLGWLLAITIIAAITRSFSRS
jgi:hypothetical protein